MTHPCAQQQTGFAAIAAIFLVVVLAALGGFMLSMSNTQQLTFSEDLQGSRAYWAARAGLEWGLASTVGACPASSSTLSILGFSVAVSCSVASYSESGTAHNLFRLTSVASMGTPGSSGRIERSLSAQVEK